MKIQTFQRIMIYPHAIGLQLKFWQIIQEEMLQISLSNIFVRLKVHQVTFHDVLKQLKEGRQSKKNCKCQSSDLKSEIFIFDCFHNLFIMFIRIHDGTIPLLD